MVGIIGDPVVHSLSPAMHNAAFEALRLDFAYVALRVEPAQLRSAIEGIRALGLAGVNVTVPHKQRVMKWLDSFSAAAQQTGAVNTIVNRNGTLRGENTDVAGVVMALREARFRAKGARCLIVGAGGAARATVAALHEAGAADVTVVNRTRQRARSLADAFRSTPMKVRPAGLDVLSDPRALSAADLIVNATSIGLSGERFVPLAFAATPKDCLFFDLIYAKRTDFLLSAQRARRRTLDGTGMLLHQGAAAFTLWTGRRAPLQAMRAALRAATRAAQ